MKASTKPSPKEKSASQQIDAIIKEPGDWRGKKLAQLRALIKKADLADRPLCGTSLLPMETTLPQRNVPKAQLGRVFGARSTLLTGGSPLGLAVGGILLAFVTASTVIAFSALACVLVGSVGLLSPAFRSLSLPSVDVSS